MEVSPKLRPIPESHSLPVNNSHDQSENSKETNDEDLSILKLHSTEHLSSSANLDFGDSCTTVSSKPKRTKDSITESDLMKLSKWVTQHKFVSFVEGTTILPCKTFLSEKKWLSQIKSSQHFVLEDLVDFLHQLDLKLN